MRYPAAFTAVAIAAISVASAAPRIAVVRVNQIYKSLEATRRNEESTRALLDGIQKDRRMVELERMLAELKKTREEIGEVNLQTDDLTSAKIRNYAFKYREAESLREEFITFRNEETRRINTLMVAEMRKNLDLISATASKIGKEQGFDLVFESSGDSNTGVPVLLYSKAPTDITEQVRTALQATPPSGEAEKPAPDAATPAPDKGEAQPSTDTQR